MTISGISSYDQLYGLYGIQGIDGTQDTTTSSTSQSSAIQSTRDQASFSPMGQMMAQLSQLQSTDATKFKETAQKISDDLASQAGSSGTIQQSTMLSDLSAKFAEAAKSGTMESLKPPQRNGQSSGAQPAGSQPPPPPPGGQDDPMSSVTSVIAQDLAGMSSNAGLSASGLAAAGPKELMEQLQQLASTAPAKFKELTQKISDDLATKAQSAGDSQQSSMLSEMSQKFADAAKSGSMDSLKPKGHHHGHKGAGRSSDSSSTSTDDPMSALNTIIGKDIASALSNAGIGANSSGSWAAGSSAYASAATSQNISSLLQGLSMGTLAGIS